MNQACREHNLPPLRKKTPFSWKRVFSVLFRVLFLILFVLLLSVGSQIIYWRYAYATFVVNGSSMYPSLNENATMYIDGVKQDIAPENIGSFNGGEGVEYHCDFGLMDNSPSFRDSLERYSVVITYFDDDFLTNGELTSGASPKIKRIIGMPGETVSFDKEGNLFINGTLTPQDFLFGEEKELFEESLPQTGEMAPLTLEEDEYFLLGDNRRSGASDDSRFEGPVSSSSLIGKAVCIIGSCSYRPADGSTTFLSYRWPWEVEMI